jgi:hypothetical protein
MLKSNRIGLALGAIVLAASWASAPPAARGADAAPKSPPASRRAGGQELVFVDPGPAKRVVFIGDATGTMISKMKYQVAELAKAIDALDPATQAFGVVVFTDGGAVKAVDTAKLLPATPANKAKVADFLAGLNARGTTDPLPAIQLAFKLRPEVIYFLTDGEFNNLRTYKQVLAEVARLNAGKKVVVHTILLETYDKEGEVALKKMATDNGGTFRYIKETTAPQDGPPKKQAPKKRPAK